MNTQVRCSPPSREYLLRLAKVGSRVAGREGPLHSPRVAAVCDGLIMALAENDALRREIATLKHRLAEAHGFGDEPTRRSDSETYPGLVARTTRTDLHQIPGIPRINRDD